MLETTFSEGKTKLAALYVQGRHQPRVSLRDADDRLFLSAGGQVDARGLVASTSVEMERGTPGYYGAVEVRSVHQGKKLSITRDDHQGCKTDDHAHATHQMRTTGRTGLGTSETRVLKR